MQSGVIAVEETLINLSLLNFKFLGKHLLVFPLRRSGPFLGAKHVHNVNLRFIPSIKSTRIESCRLNWNLNKGRQLNTVYATLCASGCLVRYGPFLLEFRNEPWKSVFGVQHEDLNVGTW